MHDENIDCYQRYLLFQQETHLFLSFLLETSALSTFSIAAAETEWISTLPASYGIRDLPLLISRASATRTIPASIVRGFPPLLWLMIAWRTSLVTMTLSLVGMNASVSRRIVLERIRLNSSCPSRSMDIPKSW